MDCNSYIGNKVSQEDLKGTRPIITFIRVSGKCNASCPFCFVKKRSDCEDMPYQDIEKIIGQLRDIGTKEVVFTGGEPLIYPGLCGLLQLADKSGLRPSFISNGYFLEKYASEIVSANTKRIIISWDSPVEEQHDSTRRIDGLSRMIKRGIEKIVSENARQNRNVEVHCNIVVNRNNINRLGEFLEIEEFKKIKNVNLIPIKGAVRMHPTVNDMERYNANVEHLIRSFESEGVHISYPYIFGVSEESINNSVHRRYSTETYQTCPCVVSKLTLFIDNNGDIYPCNSCDFKKDGPFYIGNLYKWDFNLKSICESSRRNDVMKGIRSKDVICGNCDPLLISVNKLYEKSGCPV